METWRQKAGILVLVLCLGMVLAALWYCLFLMPGKSGEQGGTFVQIMKEEVNLAEADEREGEEAACEAAWPGAEIHICPAWPGKALAHTAYGKTVKL